ncbi:MAG TPA: peptidoglycan-binding domain-containing protein [Solirubrobacteraceae bacterium]|nr:peptidoglycan-binding domain-containing protein [Solirubrobacteraceae bacterium]
MMPHARMPRAIALLTGIAALALPAAAEARHTRTPYLTAVRCVPADAKGCKGLTRARVGAQVQLRGHRLYSGMRVSFRWDTGALATTLAHKKAGWIARIPAGTKLGLVAVTVRDKAGRRSNARHVKVKALQAKPKAAAPAVSGALPDAFKGNGMWIWEMGKSEKGDVDAIAIKARATGMQTVFVKSGDGVNAWSQFSPDLVAALHAQGLKVCAWQFVYGKRPSDEAAVAAASVAAGADCFVIDAESDYEGRYAAAQTYMTQLRTAVGPVYPIALTSFPYVNYHATLPYSVFLGPGGAQANLPQVYWKAIGASVATVSARTMVDNRIYGVPIAPLGQAYDGPSGADLRAFRRIWAGYGSLGLSWWSWQSASAATWATIAEPAPALGAVTDPGWPLLRSGSKGDEVVWLQQHLAAGDPTLKIDGRFSAATESAVEAFQTAHGLPATGQTDADTWRAVVAQPLSLVRWTSGKSTATPTGETAPGTGVIGPSGPTPAPVAPAPVAPVPTPTVTTTVPTTPAPLPPTTTGGAEARAARGGAEIPELGRGGGDG